MLFLHKKEAGGLTTGHYGNDMYAQSFHALLEV